MTLMPQRWMTFFAVAVLVAATIVVGTAQLESVEEIRARAAQGDAATQYSLGLMYVTGGGVPQDYAEAVRWFRLAADQGFAGAQYSLGVMHDTGMGVPQDDDAEAAHWYRLAAEQGHAVAQDNLGAMSREGQGVPQDHAEIEVNDHVDVQFQTLFALLI